LELVNNLSNLAAFIYSTFKSVCTFYNESSALWYIWHIHSKLLREWKHIQTSTWYTLSEIYSRDSNSSSTSSLLSLWTQVWLENLCLQLPQGYHLLRINVLF